MNWMHFVARSPNDTFRAKTTLFARRKTTASAPTSAEMPWHFRQ